MEGHDGDDMNGAGYNGDHGIDGTTHGNDARTRDFLAPVNPWCHAGGSGLFPDAAQTFSGSSSFNQSWLGLESLDLNSGEDWTLSNTRQTGLYRTLRFSMTYGAMKLPLAIGQSDLMKFRKGLPEYLDQMDKMFTGNTVDGSTSFIAGESGTIDLDGTSSDEEAAYEQDDQLTPLSIGNKRASSTSTNASSPRKRSKSPALRAMDNNMRTHNEIANHRLCLMESMFEHRKQEDHNSQSALSQKIDRVTQIAKEMGISAQTPTLFRGLYNIIHNESDMDFFLANGPEERMIIIEQATPVDVVSAAATHCADPWDDLEEMMMAELEHAEDDDAFMYGMYQYALHIDKHLNRAEYRQPAMTGLEWVQRKLGDSKAYYSMFRMSPPMFHRLHDLLVQSYGLKSSTKSTSIEALGMFLWMIGAPQSVRQAEDRFERSLGTVSNMLHKILKCMVKLATDIIKPVDPQFRTMHPRLRNRRFYPYFKDCIGAIDGTHVPCVVPNHKFVQHLCRKGMTTQNVMAVCDFDMRFIFVLAGWLGSVHDMRVFNDGTTTYSHVFPHPPAGKYYLVDSGYPNRLGYLAPYKGTKYHLQEYRDAPEPQGKEETFNYAHSCLRNVIERSFGVLKMKWHILHQIPSYAPHKQSQIIVACCALHNFIRISGIEDRHFARCDRDDNYVPRQASDNQPDPEEVEDESDLMNEFCDSIAYALLNHS
ncbi:uncharacterized protein [Miscanthus floridulus]|uniref:uncharacterized protein n=1 Tax=Miscanthus floridulus TaxID=154761 RepID=UPI00345A27FA